MKTLIKSQVASRKSQVASRKSQVAQGAIRVTFILNRIKAVMLLFILLGFSTNTTTAQADCTDGIHSYVTIDQSMTVSQAITAQILLPAAQAQTQAQYVILKAPLSVDQDYHFFKGSDIIGSNSSQIDVSYGKKFYMDSTKFHGCGVLTGGIQLGEQSKLYLTNSELYNINIAIGAYGNDIELSLIGNHFENNAVSIETYKNIITSTTIHGNTFVGGTLEQPYGSEESVALKLNTIDKFTVGSLSESPNVFENYNHSLQSFIRIETEYLDITNSSYFEFLNCKFNNNTYSYISVNSVSNREDEVVIKACDFISTSIYGKNLNHLEVHNSSFKNYYSEQSIFFNNGGTILVDESTFKGPEYDPNTSGIRIENSTNAELTNNIFESLKFGIYIADCANLEGKIMDNEQTNMWLNGIRLLNDICASDFEIINNNISSLLVAIVCSQCENFHIGSNDITVNANTSLGEGGIFANESSFIKVTDNTITGSGSYNPNFAIYEGLTSYESPYSTFKCNTSQNIAVGFNSIGYSEPTALIANKFKNTQINGVKFDYSNNYGRIGKQIKNGNSWLDVLPPWNELQDPKKVNYFEISNHQPEFFYQPEKELIPNPAEGNIVVVGDYGSPREMKDYCYTVAGTAVRDYKKELKTSDFGEFWMRAMQDSISETYCSGDCEGYLSNIHYTILTGLHYNPLLLDSIPEAQIFWDNKINTVFGQIFMAGMGISAITNDYQIDSISTVLSNINTTEVYEENLRKAFLYRLKAFKSGRNWTEEETQELEGIANQCYKSGGKGVFVARALLEKERWEYDDEQLCDENIEERSVKEMTQDIIISPNPNNGAFDINIHGDYDSGKIVIYNSYGQIVYQDNFTNAQTNKRIYTHLEQGIYFIRLFADNKLISNQKIEIIK